MATATNHFKKPMEELKQRIEIKQLELSKNGIRITHTRYNQGRKEESYFPQRGEVSNNYNPNIDLLVQDIAEGALSICGLDPEVWELPQISQIKFGKDDNAIALVVKLTAKNELLGKQQRFTSPKISQLVLTEHSLYMPTKNLIKELIDFYYGKVEQIALAV